MPAVAPLVCPSCGSPVPVGRELAADVVPCRACATRVAVRVDVAELRAAREHQHGAREEAQRLADDLARPPRFFARLSMALSGLAAIGVVFTLVVWVVVGLIVCVGLVWSQGPSAAVVAFFVGLLLSIPLVYSEILHDLARTLEVDLADTLSGGGSYALLGVWFFVFLALPMILGDYAESFESVRATLRRVLAAKAPRTPRGPAECRVCGAALEVTSGTLHARCIYCEADNLVEVPAELLVRAAKDAKSEHREAKAAHAEVARARSESLQLAVGRGWRWLAGLVVAFVVFGRIVAAILDEGRTFWRPAKKDGPLIAVNAKNPTIPPDQRTVIEIRSTYDECSEQYCDAFYYVALDRGEVPTMTIDGLLVLDRVQARAIGKWYSPRYTWETISLGEGAPYRGWYRLVLRAPKKLRAGELMTSEVLFRRTRAK